MHVLILVANLPSYQRGKERNKEETRTKLKSYLTHASTLGGKTTVNKERTASGIKDTFQDFHLQKLFQSARSKLPLSAKQTALDAAVASLPADITNPIWRIKGWIIWLVSLCITMNTHGTL